MVTAAILDFHRASLEVRERFRFPDRSAGEASVWVRETSGASGAVLLSTCNRTELYLSGGAAYPAARLACLAAGVDEAEYAPYFYTLTGEAACRHLLETACGLHSQILCEDQIVTQVRKAADLAREAAAIDSFLETLFRYAVTAAKQAKSTVHLEALPSSAADQAVREAERFLMENSSSPESLWAKKRALVIGTGKMGRLCIRLLQSRGCQVTAAARSFPDQDFFSGCSLLPFDQREKALEQADLIFSATSSASYTVTGEMLSHRTERPLFIADLAVPRDVEPACGKRKQVRLLDMDSLGISSPGQIQQKPLQEIKEIVHTYLCKLERWEEYRRSQGLSHEKTESPPAAMPVFLPLAGRRVLVVGGGKIASGRIRQLFRFGAEVTVISPELDRQLLQDFPRLQWITRPFLPGAGDVNREYALILAAASDRQANQAAGMEARFLGIPVSVCDSREECTFYFPAIAEGDGVVCGIASQNARDHHHVKITAAKIRKFLEQEEKP